MSGRETPKWPRKNHANLLRSVKFPNFRSLRVVDEKGERWWKERAIRESKGQVLVWDWRHPSLPYFYLSSSWEFLLAVSRYWNSLPRIPPLFYIGLIRLLCPFRSPCSYLMHRFASVSQSSFSPLALTFPRLTFVFYTSTGVLTVYFDLDLREISWNSLGADGSLGKIPFCTQRLLSRWSKPGRSAAGT